VGRSSRSDGITIASARSNDWRLGRRACRDHRRCRDRLASSESGGQTRPRGCGQPGAARERRARGALNGLGIPDRRACGWRRFSRETTRRPLRQRSRPSGRIAPVTGTWRERSSRADNTRRRGVSKSTLSRQPRPRVPLPSQRTVLKRLCYMSRHLRPSASEPRGGSSPLIRIEVWAAPVPTPRRNAP
jgi:hypothetical protein